MTGVRAEKKVDSVLKRFTKLLNKSGKNGWDENFAIEPFDKVRVKTIMGTARLGFRCPPPELCVKRWKVCSTATISYNPEQQTYLTFRETNDNVTINLFPGSGKLVVFGKNSRSMTIFCRLISISLFSIATGV